MLSATLYSLLAGIIWAAVGVIFGKAPDDRKKLVSFFAIYSCVYFLGALLKIPPVRPDFMQLLKLAIVLIPASIAEICGFWLLKKAMNSGAQSIAWAVVQSSMILPFIGGLFLPGGKTGSLSFFGLCLLLLGLMLMARARNSGAPEAKRKNLRLYWITLSSSFLCVGTAQFLNLIPNYMALSGTILDWRIVIGSSVALVTWNGTALLRREYELKGVWKTALLYGVVVFSGQYTFFKAADAASICGRSSVVYPTAIGTCILLFSLYCVLFRKERLSLRTWCGMILIVSGIAGLSLKQ